MRALLMAMPLIGGMISLLAEPLPSSSQAFLENYCLDCHDSETQKAEINLELSHIDWGSHESLALWERALKALDSDQMPPLDKPQPSEEEQAAFLNWIDGELIANTHIGGTLARRLNQTEYLATVKQVFGFKDFTLPIGFPADRHLHGFDNLGEGLVLSPPLLEAYAETAQLIADRVFPPIQKTPAVTHYQATANDFAISYSASKVADGAMRLGMKCDPIQRSCTWPSRIEVAASGTYQFTLTLSSFRGDGQPMIAKVFARDVASKDSVSHRDLRLLEELEVTQETPQTFHFEAILYEGQTPVIHWANATLDSDRADKSELQEFFRSRNKENPRYLAAWHAMLHEGTGQGFRGGIGWERVKTQLARNDLPALTEDERDAVLKKVASNPVLYAETVVFDVFENGPALEIHELSIKGPHTIVQGPREKETERLRQTLWGHEADPEIRIITLLQRAFRRPVDNETLASYIRLYQRHLDVSQSTERAMHLVIRQALTSPHFLYRALREGPLDEFDLATRLAYFLTSAPPDDKLLALATEGRLSDPEVRRREANRLLPRKAGAPFNVNFTSQWLDTHLLPDIMPDAQFKFSAKDEESAKSEVEHFFHEMLQDNRPMTDFIDPDFTWSSARLAKNIYGLRKGFDKKKANNVHRISLPRHSRHGGLLGNAAVMMATANGVDTQPVLRGVWVLENILGDPPPPPPKAVPPITPDTQGAKTPRELLAAHTKASSCNACHRKIDPIGLLLENFDPVGRWREEWPDGKQPIESTVTLPDGTPIKDIVEFKAWLVDNIDQFSQCLAEKLLTYATGRVLNYSERKEVAAIVAQNHTGGNGFRELLLALIDSETFRTK